MASRFGTLDIYSAFAASQFRLRLAYRFANWAGLFTNTFFLFFRAYVIEACYDSRTRIATFSQMDAVSYVTVSQSLLMVAPLWGLVDVASEVRSGQIAAQLFRPISYVGQYFARRLGVSTYYLFMRAIPILTIGYASGLLAPPRHAGLVAVALFSLVLSATIANGILFVIEVSSFWLESERGVRQLIQGVSALFSGLLLPIAFFPDSVRAFCQWLPFKYALYTPVEIYLGKLTGTALITRLVLQCVWVIIIVVGCELLFRRGTRRLVIHGG